MDSGTSRPNTAQQTVSQHPQEIGSQIGSSLVQLYPPSPGVSVQIDILFFHGLQLSDYSDAHLTTWRSRNELQEVWPQAWLPTGFPEARIITVKYDSSVKTTNTEGRMDMYLIGESLMHEILTVRKDSGRNCPVVLVGHSFGGLVIKQLCCFAHRNKETHTNGDSIIAFLDSVKGIFFFGTPHFGMEGFWNECQEVVTGVEANTDLLRIVSLLSTDAGRLHHEFSPVSEMYGWSIYGVGETNPTPGRQTLLVPEASSRFGDIFYAAGCDHFSVCRPTSTSDFTYSYLVDLVRKVRDERQGKNFRMVCETMVGRESLLTSMHGYLGECRFLGLHGVGGVGKTTIAKQVFNELLDEFEYACFVENVKHISGDIDGLKKKIMENMYHHSRPIQEERGYTGNMWGQVVGKKLLVVLDDIDNRKHVELLEMIFRDNDMEDSRFIATSRSRRLLSLVKIERKHIHEISLLHHEDARQLFINHAFPGAEEPSETLKDKLEKIVEECCGLPLTLEFLGRYLRTKREEKIWDEMLTTLTDADSIAFVEHHQLIKLIEAVDAKIQIENSERPVQAVTPITLIGGDGGTDFFCYGETDKKILKRIGVWATDHHWIQAIKVWLTDEPPRIYGESQPCFRKIPITYDEFTFNPTERITHLTLWDNGSDVEEARTGWIQFETNQGRKFDFGIHYSDAAVLKRKKYEVDVGSGICVGVVGAADRDIDRLGFVFLKSTPDFRESKLLSEMMFHCFTPIIVVGGSGGTDFSCHGETDRKKLEKIGVWATYFWIKAIKVWLTDETPLIFGDPSDKRDGNARYAEFIFKPTELITHLLLWDNNGTQDGVGERTGWIQFETNHKRKFAFGMHYFDEFKGKKYEVDIDRLGFVFLKKKTSSNLGMIFQIPVIVIGSSRSEGSDFSHYRGKDTKKLRRIRVWATEYCIKAIKVWLTDELPMTFGNPSYHGKGPKDIRHAEFIFDPTERISRLYLWHNGLEGAGERVGRIYFETDQNRTFDFGMHNSDRVRKQKYMADVGSGVCVGVLGAAGDDLDRLGFVFLKKQTPN